MTAQQTEGRAAERIDVLAVMDGCAKTLSKLGVVGMMRAESMELARAAVAELVAAVSDVYVEQSCEPCGGPCQSCRIYAALRPFTGEQA